MERTNTLIVGASAAGLACAAQLKRKNTDFVILEKRPQVAHAWRNHYDRLHLHTKKSSSSLPFLKFDNNILKYPSRLQVISYLENYCQAMNIQPVFNAEVLSLKKDDHGWSTETQEGRYLSQNVVICTGNTNIPNRISRPGIESFPGKIIHSSAYKNGKKFRGKKVLVIGFGNSACEIALCLHEHGAFPSMSVRSEVNVIPRDILGISVLQIGILQSGWPLKLADKLNKPLIDLLIGNIEKYGLKKLAYGPIEQIVTKHQIPLLDIGTMKLIRKGIISIFRDIEKIEGDIIHFEKGSQETFDAVIMATGYKTGIERIVQISPERAHDIQLDIRKRKYFGQDNLYFCGFYVSPTGMLREINIESGYIAEAIIKAN